MIPRFKTRVYVLFVFPVLSVSVEGRRCEKENLGFHCKKKKLSPEKFNYFSKYVMRAGQQREAASHGLFFLYSNVAKRFAICYQLAQFFLALCTHHYLTVKKNPKKLETCFLFTLFALWLLFFF